MDNQMKEGVTQGVPTGACSQPDELINKEQEAFKEPTNLAKRRCNRADDKHEKRARDDSGSLAGYMRHYNTNRRFSGLDEDQIQEKKR